MELSGRLGNGVGKLKRGGIWKENPKGLHQRQSGLNPTVQNQSWYSRPRSPNPPQLHISAAPSGSPWWIPHPLLARPNLLFYLQSMSSSLQPLGHFMLGLASAPCQSKIVRGSCKDGRQILCGLLQQGERLLCRAEGNFKNSRGDWGFLANG